MKTIGWILVLLAPIVSILLEILERRKLEVAIAPGVERWIIHAFAIVVIIIGIYLIKKRSL